MGSDLQGDQTESGLDCKIALTIKVILLNSTKLVIILLLIDKIDFKIVTRRL